MNVEILSDVAVSPNERAVAAYPVPCMLADGGILCCYRQGSEKHSLDGVLFVQRSADGGSTWSDQTAVFDGMAKDPPQSVHAGAVVELPDGRVLAMFKTVEATHPELYVFSDEGKKLPQHFYIAASADRGTSWKAPIEHRLERAPRDHYIGVRPLAFPDGSLLIPVEALGRRGQSTVLAAFSPDGGRSVLPVTSAVADLNDEIGYGDPRLAPLESGEIVMLLWTYVQATERTLPVHRSVSADRGHSWSTPESTGVESQIMSPCALGGGRMIAASTVRTGRHGIRLWLSADDGRTWETDSPVQMWDPYDERIAGTAVDSRGQTGKDEGSIWASLPGFSFGYPDLLRTGREDLLLTYYATARGITHVRACRFRTKEGL